MGSRGQNPIRQIFMGSVSSYVSSHAICPVIIIHETPEQRREKKAGSCNSPFCTMTDRG